MPRMRAKETAALAKDRHGQKTCEDESAQAKAEILKRGANVMKERFHAAIISKAPPREASFTDARPMVKQASGAGLRCRCTAVGAASPRGCSHIASQCSLRSGDMRTPSWYQPSLFEQQSPQFDEEKTAVRGKIFVSQWRKQKPLRLCASA